MEVKINLGILVFLALVWGGLSWAEPGAALDPHAEQTRSLGDLEDRFARDHGNAALAQSLADAYLDLDRPEFAVATLAGVLLVLIAVNAFTTRNNPWWLWVLMTWMPLVAAHTAWAMGLFDRNNRES